MSVPMTGGSGKTVTPPRRPGSVRRTTSHVVTRPSGLGGPAMLAATGRDLRTNEDDRTEVLAGAGLSAMIDWSGGRLRAISLLPPEPRLDGLLGLGAYSGFRGAVLRALPGEADSHSLRYQLLDDLPLAVMANGRSLRAEGIPVTKRTNRKPPIDLCAGFAEDSTAIAGFGDMGPPLTTGPEVPDMAGDDPLAWHESASLSPHATMRIRRLDVWRDDRNAYADCFFRDSHVDRDGRHTVVHEWSILSQIDEVAGRFVDVAARPGQLPYPECPGSAGSAQCLVGLSINGLRQYVRANFVGPSTCSHLNDSYRAMEDIGSLFRLI